MYDASLEKLGEQNAVVFQIHQMMLDDPDYVSSVNKLIEKEHANAEYAVTKVAHKFEKQFLEMDNTTCVVVQLTSSIFQDVLKKF